MGRNSDKRTDPAILTAIIGGILSIIVAAIAAILPQLLTFYAVKTSSTKTNPTIIVITVPISTPKNLSLEKTNSNNTTESNIVGQINIEYPKYIPPLASDTVFARISIPSKLAKIKPESMTRVPISLASTNLISALGEFSTNILLAQTMRVDFSSPSFQVDGLYPNQQYIQLAEVNTPTQWAWTIKAPGESGPQVFIIRVFLENDQTPTWLGSFEVNVEQPVPIATITPTETPTPTPIPLPVKVFNQLVDSINLEVCLGIPATIVVIIGLFAQLRKSFKKRAKRTKTSKTDKIVEHLTDKK